MQFILTRTFAISGLLVGAYAAPVPSFATRWNGRSLEVREPVSYSSQIQPSSRLTFHMLSWISLQFFRYPSLLSCSRRTFHKRSVNLGHLAQEVVCDHFQKMTILRIPEQPPLTSPKSRRRNESLGYHAWEVACETLVKKKKRLPNLRSKNENQTLSPFQLQAPSHTLGQVLAKVGVPRGNRKTKRRLVPRCMNIVDLRLIEITFRSTREASFMSKLLWISSPATIRNQYKAWFLVLYTPSKPPSLLYAVIFARGAYPRSTLSRLQLNYWFVICVISSFLFCLPVMIVLHPPCFSSYPQAKAILVERSTMLRMAVTAQRELSRRLCIAVLSMCPFDSVVCCPCCAILVLLC
ncbi:hypothetical protein K474DRAFT_1265017 [Panus rudis PR-1116 ss-1]|nr:hypothetical protein K474DRAFT_1265017 [Panus rudis PR-1116 ss-1]